MLRSCQSRLAFSKSKWYAAAINTVFKPILLGHSRRSSALAVLEDTTHEEEEETIAKVPKDGYRRCDGFRVYDGGRCKRLVRVDKDGPAFCFSHHPNRQSTPRSNKKLVTPELKRIPATELKESRFKTPSKLFDCWQLWLGNHLNPNVKHSIVKEMLKPINLSEKPGYIYVYTLQKGPRVSEKEHTYFKIGRTINPHRRMYQFYNKCNHEPKIVELFPSFPSQATRTVTNLETLEATLDELPKCPLPHRVEKLIHLELFSMFKKAGFKCTTCESEHREWIKVYRTKHPYENRLTTDHELWLLYIRPVILKWIQYGVLASAFAEGKSIKWGFNKTLT